MKAGYKKIKIIKGKTDIDITGITLLSVDEYDEMKENISVISSGWWLRSPGILDYRAACVFDAIGYANLSGYFVDRELGVRPALHIGNPESSSLRIGDRIEVADYTWTIISDTMALCDDIISKQPFREYWKTDDAADYEASDVKKFLDAWWNNHVSASA